MADINVKRNDLSPSVTATLFAQNVVLNLTGATVKMIMKPRGGGTVKVNAACTIVTPLAGIVRYDWAGTDTDTAGDFDVEFQVTLPNTKKVTCPNGSHLHCRVFNDIAD